MSRGLFCREKEMKQILMVRFFRNRVVGGTLLAIMAALLLAPDASFAREDPPPWTFNERCMPYELDPDFMRANGVDPDKIISTFVDDGDFDGGTGNPRPGQPRGSVSPWTADFDAEGNPVPCDEFHTHRRRTRYEGCHFYDGTMCFFMTTGQLDQDSFTDDEAGRRAFEIAEHFVFYEFVQQYTNAGEGTNPITEPSNYSPDDPSYIPITIFTDPYCCGFATGSQTKIMNAAGDYWQDDPIGLWKDGLVQFTNKAARCRTNFTNEDCMFMHRLVAQNGQSSQAIGFPLVFTGDELFELAERDMISIRYRAGGKGGVGDQESARYIMCPIHEDPTSASLAPGQDNVQGYPMHFEWQPPSGFLVFPDGERGSRLEVVENFFGNNTPPETRLFDAFNCLQQTGQFCPNTEPEFLPEINR